MKLLFAFAATLLAIGCALPQHETSPPGTASTSHPATPGTPGGPPDPGMPRGATPSGGLTTGVGADS